MRMLRITALAVLLAGLTCLRVVAQVDAPLWQPWAALEPSALDDDNSGSRFADGTADGQPALMITPGGSADETKLALPVSGEALQPWREYGTLQMEVYLPPGSARNPDMFFLGLGDVTRGWSWVDGLFGSASGTSGWVRVRFTLPATLRQLDPARSYMLYLSFFSQSGGAKAPLTEPFYVGAIRLLDSTAAHDTPDAARFQSEAQALLALDDDALAAEVARQTFDYFWTEVNPVNGLVRDRSTPASVSSIAATGFGLAALPIAVERGWISANAGRARARETMGAIVSGGGQGGGGFFYHFVDMQTGERVWNSELSSIDTALLAAGALVAGQYFGGEVQTLAGTLYENIDWDWMLGGGRMVRMGWMPDSGFLDAAWDHFDESLLLYVLAIGAPAHAIPADTWDHWERPVNRAGEFIYLPGDPLFVYQYPLAFLDLRGLEDAYANYWNNAARACQRNRQFTLDRSEVYATYQHGVWGLSASDGPRGYRAYGAADAIHDGTIAPYAAASCLPLTPSIALEGMRAVLAQYGARAWREYGFVSAINAHEDWYSRDHIGIDMGDTLLMIANAQDGLVWELFMAVPAVQHALQAMGFVESSSDAAVTPAYLASAG